MGWRSQHAYENAERQAEREWLGSLPWRKRLYVRFWQAVRLGAFFAIAAFVIYQIVTRF
jgi:hypothetical protein